MSNPYESIFGEPEPERKPKPSSEGPDFSGLPPLDNGPEPLDELLVANQAFVELAKTFAQVLSTVNASQHAVPLAVQQQWLQYLVAVKDPHDQGSLVAERKYYQERRSDFEKIIGPMRDLAERHLRMLKQYHEDIDEHYFSPNRSPLEVKRDIEEVKNNLLLQRKILREGAESLSTLEVVLRACEQRLKAYVNSRESGNISASELALLAREREQLTSGRAVAFNYSFFRLNLLDRAQLGLGIIAEQTSHQYLQQLQLALELK